MRYSQITGIATAAAWFLLASAAQADPGPAALAGGLQRLVAESENADGRLNAHLRVHITNAAGDPLVMVHLNKAANAAEVLKNLKATGFRLQAVSSIDPTLVEGYLPLAQVRGAALTLGIHSLQVVQRPIKHAGSVQSQAVAVERANLAQARGFKGRGIRLGALSDSFDNCATCTIHAADDIASGDLPADGVTVLQDDTPEYAPYDGDEGRAILQLVHDIAPDAKLGFATADIGEISFSENILALRKTFKADVIVDDVAYFDEPMYSDGLLAQTVDAVHANGAAYFSSVFNNGLEAYEAVYEAVPYAVAKALVASGLGNVKLDQIPAAIRPKSVHNFGNSNGGLSITQLITSGYAGNQVDFQWDEPFNLGLVKTNFNIYVFDKNGNYLDPDDPNFPGFYSTDDNLLTDQPFEFMLLPPNPNDMVGAVNATDYQFVIGNVNDGPARHIKYIVVNGLASSERQNAPSTFGHSAARGGQSIAATYYALPKFPEDFSSPGPVTIYLDAHGNRLRQPEVRAVPQLTAVDGVDNTFFGFDSDGNGWPNFFGTSAAAPDAAAVAVLVLDAAGGSGSLTPDALYRRLQSTATPIPTPNDRSWSAALAGPVQFTADGDWTRWDRNFSLVVLPFTAQAVKSVSFNAAPIGLIFSTNPDRFSVGESHGVSINNMTWTTSPDGSTFTIAFARGSFRAFDSFRFGLSIFAPSENMTQEDPDRFRGMTVTTTLQDGSSFASPVYAAPRFNVNRFTGAGLVNAQAAVQQPH